MIKINPRKLLYYFLIGFSGLLGFALIVLVLWGEFIERKNYAIQAELSGQRLVYAIQRNTFVNQKSLIERKNTGSKDYAGPKDHTAPQDHPANKPSTHKDNFNKIAIIIHNLGLSRTDTERALSLPAEFTLGFSPYASMANTDAEVAKSHHHDILINLPLEPVNPDDDLGPYALLNNLPDNENSNRLNTIYSIIKGGVTGLYTIDDERFSLFPKSIGLMYRNILQKDILLVYGKGDQNEAFVNVARSDHIPLLTNDLFIDKQITDEDINANLQKLEKIAKDRGFAVGIAHSYPITLNNLEKWAAGLEKKKIILVPISTIHKEEKKRLAKHNEDK